MASSWKEYQQIVPSWQHREHQSAITTIHNLLNDNTQPELAAHEITSSYESCLLNGKTDLCSLWRLICLVILDSATTDQNLENIAEMLVHISRSPDVMVDGKTVKENGREYWHDVPEFSFWFMEYTMSVHTIESIDEGRTQISWSEQARKFQVANRFGAMFLARFDPDLAPKACRGFHQLALETIRDALEVKIYSSAQVRRAGIYIPELLSGFFAPARGSGHYARSKKDMRVRRFGKSGLAEAMGVSLYGSEMTDSVSRGGCFGKSDLWQR